MDVTYAMQERFLSTTRYLSLLSKVRLNLDFIIDQSDETVNIGLDSNRRTVFDPSCPHEQSIVLKAFKLRVYLTAVASSLYVTETRRLGYRKSGDPTHIELYESRPVHSSAPK